MSFENKVVIVTGSSSGIGASTAIEFAKEGAHVVLVGRNEAKLKNVREQCEKVGKKPLIVKADVSNDDDAKNIINKTIEHFGKLDVLVNNAGVGANHDILKDDFMKMYDHIMITNLRAPVYITHLAIPYLIKSKGNIINVSSGAGVSTRGFEDGTSYCVSKAGLNHFSRSIALKLAPYGIRVNIVSPGPVYTDLLVEISGDEATLEQLRLSTALKRISEPKEIADLILFLASDKAKGITGSDFVSDNADVSNDDDAKIIINKTIEHFGKLDVLVNNAGVGGAQDILKDDFMKMYDYIMITNLRAPVYITHLAIPYLIKSKGNIINVSSIAGISTLGLEDSTPYCISKAGLSHFSRSIALKLAPYGIRVNIVSPGPVYTDILADFSVDEALFEQFKLATALKRVSEPKEIADLILFLASDKAKGITGSDFVSDNGRLVK